jgi:amidase
MSKYVPGGYLFAGSPARAGRVLLGQTENGPAANGKFGRLWVIEDAFEFLDPTHRPALTGAVTSAGKVFQDVRSVRLTEDAFAGWLATFNAIKQWESWHVHGAWIRSVNPRFAPNIRDNFEAAARITEAQREKALLDRARLVDSLRSYLTGDAFMCLPTAWALAPLRTAPAPDLARNRIKDLTLCSIAGLARAPQVSIPTAADPIGLSFIAASGQDLWLLELTESLGALAI